jgi:hypothetical protein
MYIMHNESLQIGTDLHEMLKHLLCNSKFCVRNLSWLGQQPCWSSCNLPLALCDLLLVVRNRLHLSVTHVLMCKP